MWVGDRINQFVIGSDFRIRFLQVYLAVLLVGWALSLIGRKRWWISVPGFILIANVLWAGVEIIPMVFYDYFPRYFW